MIMFEVLQGHFVESGRWGPANLRDHSTQNIVHFLFRAQIAQPTINITTISIKILQPPCIPKR